MTEAQGNVVVERLSPAACRPYLVGCARTRRALIVDPLDDQVEELAARLDREGWKVDLVVDTHTHADHVSGGPALAGRLGAAYALHQATQSRSVTEKLADRQVLEVGDLRVDVVHTPGHTPDSVTLRAGRDLFTGDFLFLAQDGAGRLDLPGADPGAHWDSLQKLAEFDDAHLVHPGHDYNELDHGPLGDERVRNPRFQRVTRDEYVAWQRAIAMPTPQWMLDVLARNLGSAEEHRAHHGTPAPAEAVACATEGGGGGGACQASPMARVPLVSVDETARRMGASPAPFLLDVREPFEFSGRHAPGATLVPLGHLPHRVHELEQHKDREVLVICKSGGRSARAAEFLIACGFRRVFNVAGGTDAWVRAGLPVER